MALRQPGCSPGRAELQGLRPDGFTECPWQSPAACQHGPHVQNSSFCVRKLPLGLMAITVVLEPKWQ